MEPHATLELDQLTKVFRTAEKPQSDWRVGLEAERFGLDAQNRPLPYSGPNGLESIFDWLQTRSDWSPVREVADGPLIALRRGAASLTLEPGAQLELSGSPFATVHEVAGEYDEHMQDLRAIEEQFDVWFLPVGFHPFAKPEELPWVPKRRYPIMREYLPTRGARALDMMQRTSTVQVNLDYESEADAMTKLVTLLRLTPIIQALTLNSPFIEGRRSNRLSERLDVWMNMDPTRSGLMTALWDLRDPKYVDYVEWAVQAGMFLVLRDGTVFANTGQTFRSFLESGFRGLRATEADWQLHLGTLFPEVRLKSTLEVRCCDALPPSLALALPALLVGLTYDARALRQASELARRVTPGTALELQRKVAQDGLKAELDGSAIQKACLQLLDIARGGLRRRGALNAEGVDESIYLDPLQRLTEKGLTPAEAMIARFEESGSLETALRS